MKSKKVMGNDPKLWTFEDWHYLSYMGKIYVLTGDVKKSINEIIKLLEEKK